MMEDKWCPENDGAYRMEMAAIHRDSVDQQLHRARAEITQLRAELAAYESALEEIATYDTGSTAGLAYTAQQALDTRRNK